jgi:hypothetical protein
MKMFVHFLLAIKPSSELTQSRGASQFLSSGFEALGVRRKP